MRFKVLFIFVLIIGICFTLLLTYFVNRDNNYESYTRKTNNFKSECDPFTTNFTQISIEIDNQTYPTHIPLYQNKSLNFNCLNTNTNTKLILFWNKWFDDPEYGYGTGVSLPFQKNNCPVYNCEITIDRNRIKESDIVVFHMRDKIGRLPKYRHPSQEWIFLLYESPKHSNEYTKYNGLFNTSATYQLKSNYISLYSADSYMEWSYNANFNENEDFSENKFEFAAAIISNCNDKSKRLEYIKELQRYIPLDVYGRCGMPCPSENCKEYVSSKYKFFLAFENSVCKDYISEKFFHILSYNIIPVVYGGGIYEKHIPSSGFINELNYNNLKDLADYLLYLNRNKTAYNSYFKWKKFVRFEKKAVKVGHFCEMCIKLNLNYYLGIKESVIKDFKEFWGDDKNCYHVL